MPEPPEVAMPVMNEQVRKARAERLLQLRFEEGMRPTAAWRVVSPNSKAADSRAAELCRREIRRYRKKYGSVDVPGESRVVPKGAEAGDQASASTGDAAVKPAKRCVGVEDQPCGKEIPAQFTRCDDCGKEHTRLRRQVENRNAHLRSLAREREAEKKKREEEARQREEEKRQREEEKQRQEAEALRLQKEQTMAILRAVAEQIKAEEEAESARVAKRERIVETGYGYNVIQHPDGRYEYNEFITGYSKMLEPGEPVPLRRPKWAR